MGEVIEVAGVLSLVTTEVLSLVQLLVEQAATDLRLTDLEVILVVLIGLLQGHHMERDVLVAMALDDHDLISDYCTWK